MIALINRHTNVRRPDAVSNPFYHRRAVQKLLSHISSRTLTNRAYDRASGHQYLLSVCLAEDSLLCNAKPLIPHVTYHLLIFKLLQQNRTVPDIGIRSKLFSHLY